VKNRNPMMMMAEEVIQAEDREAVPAVMEPVNIFVVEVVLAVVNRYVKVTHRPY
jgi:hypothetical protein